MRRLRYALLFGGESLERWHLRCLDRLEECADLAGVIVATEQPSSRSAIGRSKLFRSYAERMASRFTVPVSERFAHVPRLTLRDLHTGTDEPALDFVLTLGRVSIPAQLTSVPRHGVWCFEHERDAELLPFFREVYEGADVTRAALVTLGRADGEAANVEEGYFPTDKHSYPASRHRVEDAIAAWPARVCRRLADAQVVSGSPVPAASAPKRPEPRIRLSRFRAAMARRRLALAWERFFRHPQWNIGMLELPIGALLTPGAYAGADIEWFPLDDRKGFLADPFAIVRNGGVQILCEYYGYRERQGGIRACGYTADGFTKELTPVLSLATHLSYPFLVEHSGEIYCIPEMSALNEVALFRAVEFPERWSKVATLVADFPGVDPTVFRYDDRWWLMCTRKGLHEDTELWVWHAPDVLGPWTPHARNPVKTDVRGARPAGRPFWHEGRLYRPAQDCSRAYGGRIAVQEVTRLTPTEFADNLVTMLETSRESPFPRGPHTLTPVGDLVLVDGQRTVFVWAAFRAFLAIWTADLARRVRRS